MVKAVLLFTFALSLAVSSAKAQDSIHTAGELRLKRYESVIGSCLAFSLVDYAGYNIFVKSDQTRAGAILALHVFDFALGAAINYFLYTTCGLSSAISFDAIWWTWGLDLGFFGWGELTNPAYPWINRTDISHYLGSVDWAGWTPVGLLRPRGNWIAMSTMLAQAAVGLSISMAILW
jgi:hypothetical protein